MEPTTAVEGILADYLGALEAGGALPLSDLLARHPAHAAELAEFFDLRRDLKSLLNPAESAWKDAPAFPMPFGEYELLGELGSGGMGLVFRARHLPTGRVVALKLLRGGRFASAEERRRFRTEAAACLTLDHPRIVPVHTVGEVDGQPYFSMRLMAGGSLAECREKLPDPRAAACMVAELAGAVEFAHRRGILHRDMKPSNVLFDEGGHVHLSDFGLAKRTSEGEALTATGASAGTPGYMAPEQRGHGTTPVTTATDVLGLGGILHFCLTGAPPFDAPSSTEAKAPSERVRGLSVDLDAICIKCLQRDPARRYAGAAELADELRNFLDGKEIQARRACILERCGRAVRRKPALSAVAALCFAAFLLAAFFADRDHRNTRRLNADLRGALEREGRQRERLMQVNHSIQTARACELFAEGKRQETSEQLQTLRPAPGEADGRGFLWHFLDGQTRPQRTFRGHSGGAVATAFHPDGSSVASLGRDGMVRIWYYETGKVRPEWSAGAGDFTLLAYSPDGERLLVAESASTEKEAGPRVRVFDDTGKTLADAAAPSGVIRAAEWTANGNAVYLAGEDVAGRGTLLAWRPGTERFEALGFDPARSIYALRRSPEGKTFAAAVRLKAGSVHSDIAVFPEGKPEAAVYAGLDHEHQLCSIDFHPDGSRIAAVAGGCHALVVETKGLRLAWKRHVRNEPLGASVAWADGGDAVAVAWDNTRAEGLEFLASADGLDIPGRAEVDPRSSSISRDASAKHLALACYDGRIRVRSKPVPPAFELKADQGEVWAVAFSPDGRTLATGGDGGSIHVWQVAERKQSASLNGHSSLVMAVAFAPDGGTLYSAGWDGTVRIWDVRTAKELACWTAHEAQVSGLLVSPDGRTLYTHGRDGAIKIWDVATRSLRDTLPGEKRKLYAFALSRDGTRLAASTEGQVIVIRDAGDGRALKTIRTERTNATACDFSLDGTELLLGKDQGFVLSQAADTGEVRVWNQSHIGAVARILAAPDGRIYASSAGVGSPYPGILLHDAESGKPVLALPHPAPVFGLAFSPNGKTLATGCHDGIVRLWTGSP